jgi:hypothetical protein
MMYGKDNVTDGASSDIQNATNIASALVRRFGFSTKVGPVSYSDSADSPSPSQATLREIDNEVRGLIEAAEVRAQNLLTEKKNELERLAKALVEYETLDLNEVKRGEFPLISSSCLSLSTLICDSQQSSKGSRYLIELKQSDREVQEEVLKNYCNNCFP